MLYYVRANKDKSLILPRPFISQLYAQRTAAVEFIWNEHIHDAGILIRDVITADKNFHTTLSTHSIGLPFKWNFKLSNRILFSGVFIKKTWSARSMSQKPRHSWHGRVRGTKKPTHGGHCLPAPSAAFRLLSQPHRWGCYKFYLIKRQFKNQKCGKC